MTIANHRDYGVAKLLVSDPHLAQRVLMEQGFAAALQSVLAIVIADRPGGLHAALEILAERQINVLDAYGFVVAPGSAGGVVHGGGQSGRGRTLADHAWFTDADRPRTVSILGEQLTPQINRGTTHFLKYSS